MTSTLTGVRSSRRVKELGGNGVGLRTADGWRLEGKVGMPWLGAASQEDGAAPPDPIR